MTQCFSAPPAAAIVDRNCFSVSLYSAPKPDDLAFIRVASYYPVTMFSQVRTLAKAPRMPSIASWTWCQAILTASRSPAA
jgi:D-alanyl-D-alanine carboxypeptidase